MLVAVKAKGADYSCAGFGGKHGDFDWAACVGWVVSCVVLEQGVQVVAEGTAGVGRGDSYNSAGFGGRKGVPCELEGWGGRDGREALPAFSSLRLE